MENEKILAKMPDGDKIAKDPCYQKSCMRRFISKYQRLRSMKDQNKRHAQQKLKVIALQLANSFIVENTQKREEEVTPYIKL